MRNIRRASHDKRRTKVIERLLSSGQKYHGVVNGFTTKKRFEVDLSFSSLLDGSSGIGFPEHVIFQVITDDGKMYESDETNTPQRIAQNYVELHSPVSVYVDSEDTYVAIEELPPFDPMDALKPLSDIFSNKEK